MLVVEGRTLKQGQAVDADVVVVGSGAGGAVVARTLAEAGRSVVVLEEGGYTPSSVYSQYTPTQVLRRMGREGGTTAAIPLGDTPVISVLAGRTVGGSSTMTGGICFRLPDRVTHDWTSRLGLADYSSDKLAPAFEAVERELGVAEVPADLRSRATLLFIDGARQNGFGFKPLRRNTRGCRGASYCNFGCPYHAKLSVDFSYLPQAVDRGARIYSDVRVDRVVARNGRAAGVEGVLLGEDGRPRGRLLVRAKCVVVAAGTLHTPMILRRSGLARRADQGLGRHLTLHPTFRAAAFFEQPVDAWKGAMQSVYSDRFEDEGITLMNAFPPVNVVAGAMPGLGPRFMARCRQMGHLATFGGIVHDDGGGRLWPSPTREPLLTYRMARRDKLRFLKGMGIVARAFLAAGATEVYLPVFGAEPVRTAAEVQRVVDSDLPMRRIESVTYHPLGSARMGVDPARSVVTPEGESHDLKGLFVADGSVLPTSIGVNSQLPIMGVAQKIAWGIRERRFD